MNVKIIDFNIIEWMRKIVVYIRVTNKINFISDLILVNISNLQFGNNILSTQRDILDFGDVELTRG
jgi:hypothetical protein